MISKRVLECLVLIALVGAINGFAFDIKDAFKSAVDVTSGVAKDIANILPTPQGLFETSKQLIAGYPLEFVSSAINKICSSALSSKTISPKYTPNINAMQFQLRTACDKYSFPLLKANDMWTSPHFDPSKKVVILATGWTTTVNESDAIDVLAKAFNCRGGVNFMVTYQELQGARVFDYIGPYIYLQALDAASFVDTLYTWSAFNTDELGMHVAEGLKQLIKIVPVENIHLIGHSLGAHIMGAAGNYFQLLTNETIPRITGLDPAKPCFNEGESLSGLLRGNADFIDVIHSNPGVLGKRDPIGDIDFYPGGLDPLPTGCYSVTCAHVRAWKYYAETIYTDNELNFIGARCTSLTRLREGKCPSREVTMGYAVPTDAKGNYFMEVNDEAPYGVHGTSERLLKYENCGKCE